MVKPILQARIISTPHQAQILTADLVDKARELFGPGVVYRTQTRHGDRTGYVRVYVTATATATEEGDHP